MGIKESARKAATNAASIAAATSGLSSCTTGGGTVVDPAPPPLICSSVASGQTLIPTGRRDAGSDVVTVSIKVTGPLSGWQITRVGDVVGATITATRLPAQVSDSLVVTLRLASPATTRVDFAVDGVFTGYNNETCLIARTFHVNVAATSVQVTEMNLDNLPLRARDRAEIALVSRDGRVVGLEARTPFTGAHTVSWEVTGGVLDATTTRLAHWTLPDTPGFYQAELLIDYGPAGLAFDALMLEVRDGLA